jgi:ferredoxin-type protein NapF
MTIDLTRRSLFRGKLLARPVALIGEGCFAKSGIVCRTCGDVCPEQAIRFRPRIGAPAQPEVNASACTGCDACREACPTSSISIVGPGAAS